MFVYCLKKFENVCFNFKTWTLDIKKNNFNNYKNGKLKFSQLWNF